MTENRLKFRVYDIRRKIYFNDPVPPLNSDGTLAFQSSHPDFQKYYITEQCTGLSDKNGNLIYEGDLLGGLPVVWVNELNGFRVKVNTIHGWDWHYINEFTNQEITGNIHKQAEQKDK